MPVIDYPRPEGSGLIWGCDFQNRMMVQSQGGIIVGSTIGNGISPTAASSRVTFKGTESVAVNATQMTIVLRFRTPSAAYVSARKILTKWPTAGNNNQFFIQITSALIMQFVIANAAADTSQFVQLDSPLALSTEYHMQFLYNGLLAAASRVPIYVNNVLPAQTIVGTIPPAMRASPNPLTIFQFDGATTTAPPTDFILRSARIYNRAWGLAEVQDDYANQTYSELT